MNKVFMVLVLLCVVCAAFCAYIALSVRFSAPQNSSGVLTSGDTEAIKSRMDKLQEDLNQINDILASQSVFVEGLQEFNQQYAARVMAMEKKLKDTLYNLVAEAQSESARAELSRAKIASPSPQPQMAANPSFANPSTGNSSNEEIIKKRNEQLQQRFAQTVDEMAKTINLNDYQKQEFSRMLNERKDKNNELFTQLRAQQIAPDVFKTRREELKNEYNRQIQGLLTSDQFERYTKTESMFNRRLMFLDTAPPSGTQPNR